MLGIIQWLGEAINPGPWGTVHFHRPQKRPRSRIAAIVRFLVATLLMVIWIGFLIPNITEGDPFRRNWILLATLVYLILGYFVHPKPEYRNLGWLWGLVDNPFRVSDNWNRFLVTLEVVLLPGRFVSVSMVEFVVLIAFLGRKAVG